MRINTSKGILEVEIIKYDYKKDDLGGFSSECGVYSYANFFSQTDYKNEKEAALISRGTITQQQIDKSTQQRCEMGTQTKSRFFCTTDEDVRVIIPSKYFDLEMWNKQREAAALYIQNFFRSFIAKRIFHKILILKEHLEEERNEICFQRAQEDEQNIKNTIRKRKHPEVF